MAVYLSPIANGQQFFNAAGQVLSCGKINTYTAGTTTPQATYTTSAGSVPNANPIVLNSAGLMPNEMWFSGGVTYKLVITDAANNVLQTLDNLAGINDPSAIGIQAGSAEWQTAGSATYISGTQCTFVGNLTSTLTVGRRVQAFVTAGTIYGTITASSFAGGITTITVSWDSGAFDAGLTSVNYGILSYANPSNPLAPVPPPTINVAAALNLDSMLGAQNGFITGTGTVTSVTLGYGKTKSLFCLTGGQTITPGGTLSTQGGRSLVTAASDVLTFTSYNNNAARVTITRNVYPNFSANGSTSVSANSTAKMPITVVQFNDGNCFDAVTNYRFTPTVPGRYQVNIVLEQTYSVGAGSFSTAYISLYKNGGAYANIIAGNIGLTVNAQNQPMWGGSGIVDMNGSTDYLEVFYSFSGLSGSVTMVPLVFFSAGKVDP